MIHYESQQLNIGPYLIDRERNLRVIAPQAMHGRLTGTARHLTDPARKLYIATMEEGLYEVDVHTLEVTEIIKDGNRQPPIGDGIVSQLPGYHGKGLYSGQGLLIYANNGENSPRARADPFLPSGALATWRGSGDFAQNELDAVLLLGVIGCGLDDPIEADRALHGIHHCLRTGGVFINGWDDVRFAAATGDHSPAAQSRRRNS